MLFQTVSNFQRVRQFDFPISFCGLRGGHSRHASLDAMHRVLVWAGLHYELHRSSETAVDSFRDIWRASMTAGEG